MFAIVHVQDQPSTIAGSSLLSLIERLTFDVLSETESSEVMESNIGELFIISYGFAIKVMQLGPLCVSKRILVVI